MYKYKYQKDNKTIVSTKSNSINLIYIYMVKTIEDKNEMLNSRELVAKYEAKSKKYSNKFSLEDFSPNYFECVEGCSFSLEKERKYWISIFPKGDRIQSPIIIEVDKNGEIIFIKIK